jgi:hypothetical protein
VTLWQGCAEQAAELVPLSLSTAMKPVKRGGSGHGGAPEEPLAGLQDYAGPEWQVDAEGKSPKQVEEEMVRFQNSSCVGACTTEPAPTLHLTHHAAHVQLAEAASVA